jgi:hypothetical protein
MERQPHLSIEFRRVYKGCQSTYYLERDGHRYLITETVSECYNSEEDIYTSDKEDDDELNTMRPISRDPVVLSDPEVKKKDRNNDEINIMRPISSIPDVSSDPEAKKKDVINKERYNAPTPTSQSGSSSQDIDWIT